MRVDGRKEVGDDHREAVDDRREMEDDAGGRDGDEGDRRMDYVGDAGGTGCGSDTGYDGDTDCEGDKGHVSGMEGAYDDDCAHTDHDNGMDASDMGSAHHSDSSTYCSSSS